jgi:hypothetical protein
VLSAVLVMVLLVVSDAVSLMLGWVVTGLMLCWACGVHGSDGCCCSDVDCTVLYCCCRCLCTGWCCTSCRRGCCC